ncbi:hypothetical protein [Nitrosomonas sp. Is37]|uniref:hypothetical protein n=1 Tax=Nitrosomonas sp. Is37 TaxID=3080535 RepID=UPI00294AE9BA|nr:hypothetical protein [Nitrosomonas sp. Is37]MDV6343151.1 hypothetical protein [Nitrosomonas sp. Is37]
MIFSHRLSFRRSRLFQSYSARCLSPKAATNGNALRIRRPRKLTAVLATADVRQRPDQRASRGHVTLEHGTAVGACSIHAQLYLGGGVFGALDGDRIRRRSTRRIYQDI